MAAGEQVERRPVDAPRDLVRAGGAFSTCSEREVVDPRRRGGAGLVQGRLEPGREVIEGALGLLDRHVAAL